MKINIITLGCSKNTVDSECLAGALKKAGCSVFFDRVKSDCDITIINTCGFIGDAKEESVNTVLQQVRIKSAGRKRRKLLVVGCLVERYKDELQAEIPEVDAWYGTHEWNEVVDYVLEILSEQNQSSPKVKCSERGAFDTDRFQSTPRHYAYLKISEGCNRSCSYCAIPFIRGKHVSRPMDEIVTEAQHLVSCGVKEIIVIAQDTTFYGLDIYGKRCLAELLEWLAKESGASWIRLHYTYPSSFPLDVLDVMQKYDNICKYVDVPLQHINTGVLASMQRKIDKSGILQLLQTIREKVKDVTVRTTLIVGYPAETRESFEELKQFVKEAQFDRLGVFAYSKEEGTPAESLGDPIPEEEKQRRVSEIMALQEEISIERNLLLVGKTIKVIVDRKEGEYYIGRSESDSPEVDDEILISSGKPLKIGEFYFVKIYKALEHDLMAKVQ